jgi:putative membrane protein insertion efficiency factor
MAALDASAGAVSRVLVSVLSAPIHAYRRWLSPALPARCRFAPSCSAYALDALRIHGPVIGLILGIWRVLRCHPFHPGGYDPVPERPVLWRRNRPNPLSSGASRWTST